MARASWVALESFDALEAAEAKALLGNSYHLVLARQPKQIRESIAGHFKPSEPISKSASNKVSRKAKTRKAGDEKK